MANGLLTGLRGYWACETQPDDTIVDETGNGNDIVALNGTVWSNPPGKNNLCVDQGTDVGNRAGIAAPSAFHYGANDSFTVAHWISRTTGEWTDGSSDPFVAVYDNVSGANQRSWMLFWNPGPNQFQFLISSDGTLGNESSVAVVTGDPAGDTFVHIVAGHDADADEIWIQYEGGTRQTQSHSGGAFASSTADFSFMWARFSTQRVGPGNYDELGIWDRSLSEEDVSNLYSGGAGLFFNSFDSGTDDAADYNFWWRDRRAG